MIEAWFAFFILTIVFIIPVLFACACIVIDWWRNGDDRNASKKRHYRN